MNLLISGACGTGKTSYVIKKVLEKIDNFDKIIVIQEYERDPIYQALLGNKTELVVLTQDNVPEAARCFEHPDAKTLIIIDLVYDNKIYKSVLPTNLIVITHCYHYLPRFVRDYFRNAPNNELVFTINPTTNELKFIDEEKKFYKNFKIYNNFTLQYNEHNNGGYSN